MKVFKSIKYFVRKPIDNRFYDSQAKALKWGEIYELFNIFVGGMGHFYYVTYFLLK